MSMLQQAVAYQGSHERSGYGFILGLVCVALALLVASVAFTPAPISGEMLPFVGP
jgi:tetrahydromethanopterin S-methyltransferase subunit B